MLSSFVNACKDIELSTITPQLLTLSNNAFNVKNGNKDKWLSALAQIKKDTPADIKCFNDYLYINTDANKQAFKKLNPWRKGPFKFNNFTIDSEWNSFIKWQRIKDKINLKNKIVLDVGSNNGYFTLQMVLNGSKIALGIDPYLLFNYQFQAIKLLCNKINAFVLPLKLEQLPNINIFDIIFSMGVLYHHKSPIEHIMKLKNMLKNDGELILETLIVNGIEGYSLTPKKRYAKMNNVWFIPTIKTLKNWLNRCGFNDIKIINTNITTINEQRKTKWLGDNAKSLIDFINSDNLTIEGYPRPKRIIILCKK